MGVLSAAGATLGPGSSAGAGIVVMCVVSPLDGGGGGASVADPGGWLDAYCMGRYYGLITPPHTDDPSLTTVPQRSLRLGAAPYSGPTRPKLWHEGGQKNPKTK